LRRDVHPEYQERLISEAIRTVEARAAAEPWPDVAVQREREIIFVTMQGVRPGDDYLTRIDMSTFPIEPYEIGFVDPRASLEDRLHISDRDPRYWPWSPMPGLHGSFNIHFARAIRVFWCRDCTSGYYYYHGREAGSRWQPAKWPLVRVVAELRNAVRDAQHPRHWRPVQRPRLLALASERGIQLPANAGIDDG
jgi:hypothetical protein